MTADDFEDSPLVYGDVDPDPIDQLDEFNDCCDPGGHVWLQQAGDCRCIHCGVPAMPVYATRELN